MTQARTHNRSHDALREFSLIAPISRHAEGSCEVRFGDTVIRCTASVENRVPSFLRGKNQGWLTAEYAMLPRATHSRNDRAANLTGGRTREIQRFIGRALRSACDFSAFPDWQIRIDCDVIEADGGTRTAAINGSFVATALAFAWLQKHNHITRSPIKHALAAISCGIIAGEVRLDLDYHEAYLSAIIMPKNQQ